MRVTVVCSVFPPALSPEAPHASLLCRNLATAGCDVTLITTKLKTPKPTDFPFALRDTMEGWAWNDRSTLMAELKNSRPDAVLLIYLGWIYDRHPMVTFLPTMCRQLPNRPRVVTQFENTGGSEPVSFGARLGRKLAAMRAGESGIEYRYGTLLRDSDAVITLCEQHLKTLVSYCPDLPTRSHILPAPALLKVLEDPTGDIRRRTRERLGYAADDFVTAYFGYIYPEKGVETVIEGAAAALESAPNFKLLMIGGTPANLAAKDPGYGDRMKALCDERGLAGRVHWTGHCEPEGDDASSYLHATDCCVLPFLSGIRLHHSSYAVATSHGLPVISTKGEDCEAAFVDRQNVMLCPPKDAACVGRAIAEVATDPTLRQALQAGATAFSQGRSSWPAVTRQTIEILKGNAAASRPLEHAYAA